MLIRRLRDAGIEGEKEAIRGEARTRWTARTDAVAGPSGPADQSSQTSVDWPASFNEAGEPAGLYWRIKRLTDCYSTLTRRTTTCSLV